MCLAQGHNAVTPVRLKLVAPRSPVKHSTTKPLCSLDPYMWQIIYLHGQALILTDNFFGNCDWAQISNQHPKKVNGCLSWNKPCLEKMQADLIVSWSLLSVCWLYSIRIVNLCHDEPQVWKQCRSWSVAGPRSAVGNVSGYRCASDWRSRGREFDPGPAPCFCGDWSWNDFYGHSPPSADSFKKGCCQLQAKVCARITG